VQLNFLSRGRWLEIGAGIYTALLWQYKKGMMGIRKNFREILVLWESQNLRFYLVFLIVNFCYLLFLQN